MVLLHFVSCVRRPPGPSPENGLLHFSPEFFKVFVLRIQILNMLELAVYAV